MEDRQISPSSTSSASTSSSAFDDLSDLVLDVPSEGEIEETHLLFAVPGPSANSKGNIESGVILRLTKGSQRYRVESHISP